MTVAFEIAHTRKCGQVDKTLDSQNEIPSSNPHAKVFVPLGKALYPYCRVLQTHLPACLGQVIITEDKQKIDLSDAHILKVDSCRQVDFVIGQVVLQTCPGGQVCNFLKYFFMWVVPCLLPSPLERIEVISPLVAYSQAACFLSVQSRDVLMLMRKKPKLGINFKLGPYLTLCLSSKCQFVRALLSALLVWGPAVHIKLLEVPWFRL